VLLELAELPPFPSDTQVASFLNCSTRTLRRWRSVGLLKGIRLGDGHPRLSRGEVARFICAGWSNA
jgi:excisionase family DNA binding protein